jgi:hypothetical protein
LDEASSADREVKESVLVKQNHSTHG